MSYVHMDHATWVERQIESHKKLKPNAKERRNLADGKGWHAAPETLNEFHRRAFNILGIVGNGIYNAPIGWSGLNWWKHMIIVPWRNGLGTWDFNSLTCFVFLCHDARIRGYIEPGAPRHVNLFLSERKAAGDIAVRHPNLAEAVAAWREDVPLDHAIAYREQTSEIAA